MNLNVLRDNRLIYVPFKRISAKANEDTSSMGWSVLTDGSGHTHFHRCTDDSAANNHTAWGQHL